MAEAEHPRYRPEGSKERVKTNEAEEKTNGVEEEKSRRAVHGGLISSGRG